ncbi:hypothetical protein [Nonomuraea dietziae]|uniref:restriction endonuclease-related protein n=1 Tax=Nonomuraea dietziae TaxID=65515 RepID=UPI0033CC2AB7
MNDASSSMGETGVRYRVMTAAAMAAHALTDTEQSADSRLQTLMDAHGRMLAARGPHSPLTFSAFRDLLRQDLSLLLPDGVPAEEMENVCLITPDGQFDDDLYDLEQEQRLVMRTLAKAARGGRPVNGDALEAEMDQEKVYMALKKRLNQTDYVAGRSALIQYPAGPVSRLRKLNLPSTVADFYHPIEHASIYDRWWFACPICRWPMKVTITRAGTRKTGNVQCFHRPHRTMGAAYHFKIPGTGRPPTLIPAASAPPVPSGNASVLFADTRGAVPDPIPAENHVALTRGVWRWTTVPGLVEIDLHKALEARGLRSVLWPDLDAYDLHVEVGTAASSKTVFRIDLKDYSNAILLAKKIRADEGDAGGADWLVVPDYRAASLPLLSSVCKEFGLNVATAGDIGALVCEKAGVSWA